MTDFILQTDPAEFQNTRQNTKMVFLQNEVKQLQDHIHDLEQIIKINKDALKITTISEKDPKKKTFSNNESIASTNDTVYQKDHQNLASLVQYLQEENYKLLEIIEKLKKERNVAQSKALISEQICEEAQRHEAELVSELDDKINELRKLVQDKEYTIQELEKLKAIPEQDGVVIKFREVLSPTEQNLKLHNELDAVNAMLAKVQRELNKCQAEKQEIAQVNFTLMNELSKIKATFSSPLNFPQKMGIFGGEQLNNSVQYLVPSVMGFDDENSPFPSPLPDKVNQQGNNKAPVPKLDLTKAKKIQEINAKKIGDQQPAANQNQTAVDPKIIEKLHKQGKLIILTIVSLEGELEICRKRLSFEIINNKILSDEIVNLQRQNQQLTATNDILIKSNKRYEEKWQKIFYTLEFYKEFYHKYIDLITNRRAWNRSQVNFGNVAKMENAIKLKEKFNIDIDTNPDQLIKEIRKNDEENGKEVNVSILDAEENPNIEVEQQSPGVSKNVYNFSKEQCKRYLLNLAKDLYVNTNVHKSALAKKILQNLDFGHNNTQQGFKMKRSVSNPLDYVSERKKLIFEPQDPKDISNKSKFEKQRKKTRLFDDQELNNKNGSPKIDFIGTVKLPQKQNFDGNQTFGGDEEPIEFVVDEETHKKMADVSFISTHEILDHMK